MSFKESLSIRKLSWRQKHVFQNPDFGSRAQILPLATKNVAVFLEVRGSLCSFLRKYRPDTQGWIATVGQLFSRVGVAGENRSSQLQGPRPPPLRPAQLSCVRVPAIPSQNFESGRTQRLRFLKVNNVTASARKLGWHWQHFAFPEGWKRGQAPPGHWVPRLVLRGVSGQGHLRSICGRSTQWKGRIAP